MNIISRTSAAVLISTCPLSTVTAEYMYDFNTQYGKASRLQERVITAIIASTNPRITLPNRTALNVRLRHSTQHPITNTNHLTHCVVRANKCKTKNSYCTVSRNTDTAIDVGTYLKHHTSITQTKINKLNNKLYFVTTHKFERPCDEFL
jgi:hypothetical protein